MHNSIQQDLAPHCKLVDDTASAAPAGDFGAHQRFRLIRDAIINYSGLLASAVIAVVLVPVMLHVLGAVNYGLWIAALSLVGIVEVLDFGLEWALTREVAMAAVAGDCGRVAPFVTTAALLYAATGVLAGLLMATLSLPLKHLLGVGGTLPQGAVTIFAIHGVTCFGNRISKFATAVLEGLRRFDVSNMLMTAAAMLRAAGIGVILFFGGRLVPIALWWAFVALLIPAVALGNIVRLQPQLRSAVLAPWKEIRGHLHFGVISQVNMGLTKIVWESAPVIAGVMLGPAAIVPLYIGQRFPFALSQFNDRSAAVVYPAASEAESSQQIHRDLLEAGTRSVLLFALPACVVLWVLTPQLLHAWVEMSGSAATSVMRITVVAVLVDAFGLAAMQILWARRAIWRLGAIFALMGFVCVGLTTALLRPVGIAGAAWAFLTSISVGTALALATTAKRHAQNVLRVVSQAVQGLLLPSTACGLAAAALVRAVSPGRIGVIAAALAGLLVYAGVLGLHGAREEERHLIRRFMPGCPERSHKNAQCRALTLEVHSGSQK